MITPPRESGVLAGTLRAQLIEEGQIRERVLTLSQLSEATDLWLINSLRGWVPVSLEARTRLSNSLAPKGSRQCYESQNRVGTTGRKIRN
jgi:para-aminobenzoate synthetase/4-amino-4-deoxychorismate lyase